MLSPAQQRVVEATGHVMCVACPGAGKTFTMSQRAGHLVSVHAEGNLAAVSFTAAAAGELRERILRTVSCSPKRIGAGTFHSLAKHQLTQAGIKVKLASEMQTRQAIENLAATAGVDANDLISAIDLFKSDPYPSEPAAEYRAAIRDYQSWLDREGLMDFSDLLRRAVAGMADGSVAPMNVRWMLADEIQDADAMQWAWLFAHAKAGVELTCVGDEDQSIYRWRNALGYAGMREFIDRYGAKLMQLDVSYRCDRQIIETADRLIRKNAAHRTAKQLRSASNDKGSVNVRRFGTLKLEADGIANELGGLDVEALKDWAVLARSNADFYIIEAALQKANIPYYRANATSFWDTMDAKRFLMLMSDLGSGEFSALASLLQAAGITESVVDRVRERCRAGAGSPLERFSFINLPSALASDVLRDLQVNLRAWIEHIRGKKYAALAIGVSDWLIRTKIGSNRWAKQPDRFVTPFANLKGSIAQRLRRIQELIKEQNSGQGVTLCTLHASKGLEWRSVWLFGVHEGRLPHENGNEIEERCLAYVGMTRAKSNLIIGTLPAISNGTGPSSFLAEAELLYPVSGQAA